jgi:hypothetical protein
MVTLKRFWITKKLTTKRPNFMKTLKQEKSIYLSVAMTKQGVQMTNLSQL